MFDAEHKQHCTTKKGANSKRCQVGDDLPRSHQRSGYEEREANYCYGATDSRTRNEHERYANSNGRWLKETSNYEREGQQEHRAGDYNQCCEQRGHSVLTLNIRHMTE